MDITISFKTLCNKGLAGQKYFLFKIYFMSINI
jgi:hypothetical protein